MEKFTDFFKMVSALHLYKGNYLSHEVQDGLQDGSVFLGLTGSVVESELAKPGFSALFLIIALTKSKSNGKPLSLSLFQLRKRSLNF